MLRLILVVCASYAISLLSLWASEGGLSELFNDINLVMYPLGALFGALSLAFFNYLEGVIKDVPKKMRLDKPESYRLVILTLTSLKREVVVNVVVVVVLILISFFLGPMSALLSLPRWDLGPIALWSGLAVKGACLISTVVIVFNQLSGFVIANDLRAEIALHSE